MNLRESLEELLYEYKAVEGIDLKEAVKDALADLMHLCEKKDIDWTDTLKHAKHTFEGERDA